MFSNKFDPSKLCLACILTMTLFLQACRKEESASAADVPNDSEATNKATEPALTRAEYANDLVRLDKLTERINRACRGSNVVVLGAGDSVTGSGIVSVDYALFDRLSDDGATVLIAEAVAARAKSPSPSQIQIHVNTENNILQTDEAVGRYIARAGFSSGGFAEWLNAKKSSVVGLQQNGVPEKMRIAAFMRGYSSESLVRKGR